MADTTVHLLWLNAALSCGRDPSVEDIVTGAIPGPADRD